MRFSTAVMSSAVVAISRWVEIIAENRPASSRSASSARARSVTSASRSATRRSTSMERWRFSVRSAASLVELERIIRLTMLRPKTSRADMSRAESCADRFSGRSSPPPTARSARPVCMAANRADPAISSQAHCRPYPKYMRSARKTAAIWRPIILPSMSSADIVAPP